MDNWGRRRSDYYYQPVARTRSQYGKPPQGNWQTTVPSWERKFCAVVGSLPWRNFLDAKRFIHLFDNVLKWNDSAGEEAFINAKKRYWAQINGLSCQIPSPDPDMYIDKIDWNSDVDPQLILDLESDTVQENQEKGEQVVILGLVPINMNFPTGWGDAEVDMEKTPLPSENKGNYWEDNWAQAKESTRQNGWEDVPNDRWCEDQGTLVAKKSGWEDVPNDGWCEDQGTQVANNSGREDGWSLIPKKEDSWNQWGNKNYESDDLKHGRNPGVWKRWDANHRNQENTGGCMSRYKTSRFHGNENPTNREWRNRNWREKVNFVHEQPYTDSKQNLMDSCAPIRHHRSANRGNHWSWRKPVS